MDKIEPTDREVVVRYQETMTVATFTVEETIALMKKFANLCVAKKLIDMGYKDYCDGDPESELVEMIMDIYKWQKL